MMRCAARVKTVNAVPTSRRGAGDETKTTLNLRRSSAENPDMTATIFTALELAVLTGMLRCLLVKRSRSMAPQRVRT